MRWKALPDLRYIPKWKPALVALLAVLLAFAITGIARAYVRQPYKWATNPVTYDKHTLSSSWVTAVWSGAFQWNDVSPSPFQWSAGDSGLNDLYLSDIDGKYGVFAVTNVHTKSGNPSETSWFTIQFDSAETWYTEGGIPGSDKLDAIGVAAHELGHALGLGHTQWWRCISNPPTMCASYSYGSTYFRSLETDDKNGLNAQYP